MCRSHGWLRLTSFATAEGSPAKLTVSLEADLVDGVRPPKELRLLARRGGKITAHRPAASNLERIAGSRFARRSQVFHWRLAFELPPAVGEDARTSFQLIAEPHPVLDLPELGWQSREPRPIYERPTPRLGVFVASAAALLAGLAPGFALADGGSSGSSTLTMSAQTVSTQTTTSTATTTTTTVPVQTTSTAIAPPPISTSQSAPPTTTATTAPAPPLTTTSTAPATASTTTSTTSTTTTTTTSAGPKPGKPGPSAGKHRARRPTRAKQRTHSRRPSRSRRSSRSKRSAPHGADHPAGAQHGGTAASRHLVQTGGSVPKPQAATPPAPAPDLGDGDGDGDDAAVLGSGSLWTNPVLSDPFTSAQLRTYAALVGGMDQPPKYLQTIYRAAAHRYGIPWQVLAAINYVETRYGQDLAVSPAGAIGWMQFMPATWAQYGQAVNLQGRPAGGMPNPWNPTDAIFAAARYLTAAGARRNLPGAVYAYNHAGWYVAEVLSIAEQINHQGIWPQRHAKRKLAAMLTMARLLNGLPYVWGGGHSSFSLISSGYDCSGFVSAVLHAGGYLQIPVTTQSLPGQPLIKPGPGRYVTIFDRTYLSAAQDHVIIDIDGQWWESGGWGVQSDRVHRMRGVTAAYLKSFNLILHPQGL
ncbi:MAG TPA: lytic murein transglycosylase [Solirubrobacteraceae bacterium]|nr:lytic murein transglycosylase [Solirubrobacteraceae bacterium]